MFDFNPQNGRENLELIRKVLNGPYDKLKIVGMTKEKFIGHLSAIRTEHVDAQTDGEFYEQLIALESDNSDRLKLQFEESLPRDPVVSQLLDVLHPFSKLY